MKPIGNRLLVEPITKDSEGTIFIPETVRAKPLEGIVRAVGDKVREPITVGQRVLLKAWYGWIEIGQVQCKLVNVMDVIAVYE